MREILPGIDHWTVYHEPIRARVSSCYVAAAGIVIDPKVPDEDSRRSPGSRSRSC